MHILTINGLVYTFGIDYHKYGILGMGDLNFEIRKITLNQFFQKNKINFMSISEKYCVCINNQHNILIFGTFKNNTFLFPKEINNDNHFYYNKVKCSENYFVIMDFSGYLTYYGNINSNINFELNEKIKYKKLKFDYKNEQIDDFICGKNFVCILDKKGNCYLYNEEGLYKIKINEEIKQIYLMKNSFFLLGKNFNIYIIQNNKNSSNISDFIVNSYEINKEINYISIVPNYYYEPLDIIFIMESSIEFISKLKEKTLSIFNLSYSKDSKDNFQTIFSKKIHESLFNINDSIQSFILNDSVLPVNYSLSKLSLNSTNINTTKKNFRISKISNLLEKVFDHKFNEIRKKRAKSVKRSIIYEKINESDYNMNYSENDNNNNNNLRSKCGNIFSVQESLRFKTIKEENLENDSLRNKKEMNLNKNDSNNNYNDINKSIKLKNLNIHLTNNLGNNNNEKKHEICINNTLEISNKQEEIFYKKNNKQINFETQYEYFNINNNPKNFKILSISKSQLNISKRKKREIKTFNFDKSDKKLNMNKENRNLISLNNILDLLKKNKEKKEKEIVKEKKKQLEKEKEINRLKEIQKIQNLEIEKQKIIGNEKEKEKELNKLKELEIQKDKEIKEFQLKLNNLENDRKNYQNIINKNINEKSPENNKNQFQKIFSQIKPNNQIFNTEEKTEYSKSKFNNLNLLNKNYISSILTEQNSPLKNINNENKIKKNLFKGNNESKNVNSDFIYKKVNTKNYIQIKPKKLLKNNSKDKVYKKDIIKNSKIHRNINNDYENESLNLINKNIMKVNSKEELIELLNKAKENNINKSLYYQIENDESKIIKVKNKKIEIIQLDKIDSIIMSSNNYIDDESFKMSNSSENLIKITNEENLKLNNNKRNNPIKLVNSISTSNLFKTNYNNIKTDNYNLNKNKKNYLNLRSKSINKFLYNEKNINNNLKNKENNIINNKRSSTPINKTKKKNNSNQKKKNKFLPNKKKIGYENFIKYHNNEKIMKAVEKLKEKYLNYLQRIYGNQNLENKILPESIDKEDFLIRDFMNSEIKINNSDYFIPNESFISQIEMENFFIENLRCEKIKNKLRIIDNNFIIDTLTTNQNLISYDEEEKNISYLEPIELEKSGNIINNTNGKYDKTKLKMKYFK